MSSELVITNWRGARSLVMDLAFGSRTCTLYLVVYASEIIPLGNITGSLDERWAWLSVLVAGAFIGCFDGLLKVFYGRRVDYLVWQRIPVFYSFNKKRLYEELMYDA